MRVTLKRPDSRELSRLSEKLEIPKGPLLNLAVIEGLTRIGGMSDKLVKKWLEEEGLWPLRKNDSRDVPKSGENTTPGALRGGRENGA